MKAVEKQLWSAGQVVSLREFFGLSAKTVVMYGFSDHFCKQLESIGKSFSKDKALPDWNKPSQYARKDNDNLKRQCFHSIYTAASRAELALIIVDTTVETKSCFLGRIVECSGRAAAAAAAAAPAAVQKSTPPEWFERAFKDFSNNLIDNARAILSDEIKMGYNDPNNLDHKNLKI